MKHNAAIIYKYILLGLLLLFISIKTQAQKNLVPNYSFEIYTKCPQLNDNPPPHPWYLPTSKSHQNGTYVNACSNDTCLSVPYNCFGVKSYQNARTGQAYDLITTYFKAISNSDRYYLQTKLKDSLRIGKLYYADFFVSSINFTKYGSNNISMLFTKTAKYVDTLIDERGVINENAQIVNYGNPIIKDTMNWLKVSGIFTAQGGEQYLTLGNFKYDNQTQYKPIQSGGAAKVNYYIDDVAVYNLDSFCLKADAGRDTTIAVGDSVFIGSYTNGIDTIKWYNSNGQLIDSIRPGFWVKPTSAGTYMYVLQQTVNGCFSKDTVYVNVTTLPLKMVGFTVIYHPPLTPPQEGNVLLQWQTANEINVSHYNIERSFNGNDFTVIGKVKANNKPTNHYTFTDQPTPKTKHQTWFYRIAGVDYDGRKTFSQTKTINYKPQTINVSVFPNPAKDVVNIESKEAIKEVRIIDCWGKEVSKSLVNSQSTYKLVINNHQLAKGLYVVQVTTVSGKVLNEKLIIEP